MSDITHTSKIDDIFVQEYSIENQALWDAVKDSNIIDLKDALAKGANPNFINQHDQGNPTPLHETVQTSDSECTKELLQNGACVNITRIDTRNTPLHEAAANGNEKICELLIKSHALEMPNAYGNTPLFSAVRAGSVEIVYLLLENGHDINARNHLGSSLLHLCSFLAITSDVKDDESLKSVLDENNKNKNNTLALQPHLHIAAILLSSNKFKLMNSRDENGFTALHVTAQRGHDDMVKLLVDSGADTSVRTNIDEKGRGGRTAYGMAKFAGKAKTCELLEDIENKKDAYVSGKLASDLQSGYSIRNPIVGSGALGIRKMSNSRIN